MLVKRVLPLVLLAAFSSASHAVLINLNYCVSSCTNIGTKNGSKVATAATLSYVNGSGGVNFTLTNMSSNLGGFANAGTFLSRLFLNVGPASSSSFTLGPITQILLNQTITNAGLSFNTLVSLSNSGGPSSNRLLNGQSVNFFIGGITTSSVVAPTMVHFQALSNGGSVKIRVPEPSSLLLVALGFFGIRAAAARIKNAEA